MSMKTSVYGLSFFLTQALFAFLTAILITLTFAFLGILQLGGVKSFLFLLAVTLYGLSMIFQCMAISTLFSDPRLSSQIGTLLLIVPLALFNLLRNAGFMISSMMYFEPRFIYIGYMFPFFPTSVIIGRTINVYDFNELSIAGTWIALILSLPVYYGLYVYLD